MKNRNLDAWIEFMDITMQRLLNLSLLELELISINFYAKCNRKSIFSHVKVLVLLRYLVLLRLYLVLLRLYLVLYHIFDHQRTNTFTFFWLETFCCYMYY